jgi:hypothetical protein
MHDIARIEQFLFNYPVGTKGGQVRLKQPSTGYLTESRLTAEGMFWWRCFLTLATNNNLNTQNQGRIKLFSNFSQFASADVASNITTRVFYITMSLDGTSVFRIPSF